MQIIYTRTFGFLPVSAEMTSGFICEHGTGGIKEVKKVENLHLQK